MAPEAATVEAVAPEAVAPEAVAAPTGRAVVGPPASHYHAAGVASMLPGRREDAATDEAVTSRPRSAGQEREGQQQRERSAFLLHLHLLHTPVPP
jgi:hypothetical protein